VEAENQGNSDQEILARARARFTLCEEAEAEVRQEAVSDLKFCTGDQWPADVKTARELDKRPCLTINRLTEQVRQVLNEQRQNRPAIKVNPVDDQADIETAEVLQGLIRHIEYYSNAEIAYDTASDGQVKGGFGYFRIVTDYCDPMSFDLDILIKRIRDPFSVYLDPNYTEPDGSDIEYGFIIDTLSKESYKRMFPDSNAGMMTDWASIGASSAGWMNKDEIRVAEYYEKQFKKTKVHLLSDGRVVQADEIDDASLQMMARNGQVPHVVNSRETEITEVKWYKINGIDILDRTDVHGSFIPIIPVLGDEYYVDGKRILESLVRHAKDPQRMYNYWKTAATEMIALAPKAPFIGMEGQFEGFEDQWKQANTKSYPFLQYKNIISSNGQGAPPPQRVTYEPPVQAINQQAATCIEDIKATTGIYDASLGNRAQELSGVALQRRINQSNVTNFHFSDNFKRSLRHAGDILLEWIPKVYNKAQAVRVLGVDGQQKIVRVNEIFNEGGEQKGYFLGEGKYDVTIDTGPSYQTKRQEAVADMLDLTKSVPQTMQNALDLLVRNMDWPEASKIADRLKKLLPPGLAESDDKGQAPLPPGVQAHMAQAEKIMQQQSQLIAQQDEAIKTKKIEMESKERIEAMKMRNDIVLEYMKHDLQGSKALFDAEISQIDKRLELLHEQARLVNEPGDGQGPQGPAASPGQEQQPTGGQSPG
jgi:hypothetical protein